MKYWSESAASTEQFLERLAVGLDLLALDVLLVGQSRHELQELVATQRAFLVEAVLPIGIVGVLEGQEHLVAELHVALGHPHLRGHSADGLLADAHDAVHLGHGDLRQSTRRTVCTLA